VDFHQASHRDVVKAYPKHFYDEHRG